MTDTRLRVIDLRRVTRVDADPHPQRVDLCDLQETGRRSDRLPGHRRDALHDSIEWRRHDQLTLLTDRIARDAGQSIARGRDGGDGHLMLSTRLLDTAHARRSVFEQLFESLQSLPCGQLLGLGRRQGALRLDPLIAFSGHQRRDRHERIAFAHARTRKRRG